MEFILNNIWIVAFLPLWAGLVIIFGQNYFDRYDKKISMYLVSGVTLIGLFLSLIALIYCANVPNTCIEQNYIWMNVGKLRFCIGWLVDNLSSMMLCVVTSVSLLIQTYSHGYMEDDPSYHRFFAYLGFFNFAMLGLVLSTNLFQTYIFWELVGVASYLLIGFWYKKQSAAKAAQKAFVVNRIGDFGLLVGTMAFLYLSFNYWAYEASVLLEFSSLKFASDIALITAGKATFTLIGFLMFLGPVAKSAQFPLHVWLPDAMEGPTPISALIHAATMVAAGVYLIARLYPLFELSPELMSIIAWCGAITAVIGATVALVQYDIKKALAYSTCSQLGYMVLAMGVGAYSAGLFHLMTHAYFKAMLFLCSGAVIHSLSGEQDMRCMGGLRKKIPVVAYTYLIGTLSISGIFLSGFFSKEQILSGVLASGNNLLFNIAIITAGLTAFYMFRTYFLTFEGDYKGSAHIHKPSKFLTKPLLALAVPSALFGLFFNWGFPDFISHGHVQHEHFVFLPLISIIVAILGVGLAAIMYYDKLKVFSADILVKYLKPLYNFLANKWFIEIFYEKIICRLFSLIASALNWVDKFIIDGLVNLNAKIVDALSVILNVPQEKTLGTYIATSVVAIVGLCVFAIGLWYLVI